MDKTKPLVSLDRPVAGRDIIVNAVDKSNYSRFWSPIIIASLLVVAVWQLTPSNPSRDIYFILCFLGGPVLLAAIVLRRRAEAFGIMGLLALIWTDFRRFLSSSAPSVEAASHASPPGSASSSTAGLGYFLAGLLLSVVPPTCMIIQDSHVDHEDSEGLAGRDHSDNSIGDSGGNGEPAHDERIDAPRVILDKQIGASPKHTSKQPLTGNLWDHDVPSSAHRIEDGVNGPTPGQQQRQQQQQQHGGPGPGFFTMPASKPLRSRETVIGLDNDPNAPEPARDDAVREAYYQEVFKEFLKFKVENNESIDNFTYDKFATKLRATTAGLMKRPDVKDVQFSVYIKDGKVTLKARTVRA